MTDETGWTELVARLSSARSSPILMPASIFAVLDLCKQGRVSEGRVAFADFESVFRKIVGVVTPNMTAKAWLPFYHLSGRVGLWTLHGEASLPEGWKPTGRTGLVSHVQYAQIAPPLAASLNAPDEIDAIESAILDMLTSDGKPDSDALVQVRRGIEAPV